MNKLMPIEMITAAPTYKGARSMRHDVVPDGPCDGCPCHWVCSGSKREGGAADFSEAMACSLFQQFARVTPVEKRKIQNPNQMPSRALYVAVFE